jgi:NAD(P)-dependent dehydrogenase (short-subunit alcohol dehydrogenase family)
MLNEGQVCVVTGGGRGIGRGIADVLAAEGATVVLAARDGARLEAAASSIRAAGGEAHAATLDITDRPAVRQFAKEVRDRFGRVDVLVNNAGLMPMPMALTDMPDELWDDLLAVNATGTFNMTKAVLPGMIEQRFGRIINISSISAKYTWANFVGYGAAKGALHAFTTALAKEVAAHGITVNCVLPGFTRTEEMERIWGKIADAAGTTLDELVDPILADKVPMNRWIQPREIGQMVAFLASRRADAITGQMHPVDGGLDAHD